MTLVCKLELSIPMGLSQTTTMYQAHQTSNETPRFSSDNIAPNNVYAISALDLNPFESSVAVRLASFTPDNLTDFSSV